MGVRSLARIYKSLQLQKLKVANQTKLFRIYIKILTSKPMSRFYHSAET